MRKIKSNNMDKETKIKELAGLTQRQETNEWVGTEREWQKYWTIRNAAEE